jgi:hypothetical protein
MSEVKNDLYVFPNDKYANAQSLEEMLTDEEKKEMTDRPIGTINFTAEQFAIRDQIGKKLNTLFYRDAFKNCPDIAKGYLTHPIHKFYTNDSDVKRRIVGMSITDSGKLVADTVTAMTLFNNRTVGGCLIDELNLINYWNSEQLSFLKSGLINHVHIFLDPIGVISVILE